MDLSFRTPRRRALAVGAAAIACLAVLAPAVALAAQDSPAAPQAAQQCTSDNTYVWFALAPNGTLGPIYYPIEFTNTGSSACWLEGYPGVSAAGGSTYRDVGRPAGRLAAKPHRVVIGRDQTAHAELGIIPNGFIAGCHSVNASGLAVFAPNQTLRQLVTSFTFSVCKNKVSLHVFPVTPGIGVP
jgi:hypothetical protein